MTDNLEIHALAVGEGDCIVVKFPDKSLGLIDCGSVKGDFNPALFVSTYIRDNSDETSHLRFVLVTHPDNDHDGGINALISNPPRKIKALYYSAERLIDSNEPFGVVTYLREAQRLFREGDLEDFRVLREGDSIPIDISNLSLDILGPNERLVELYSKNLRNSENRNRLSIVLQMTYGENIVLLCGDATDDALLEIYTDRIICCPVVLKVPHHGRKNCLSSLSLKTHSGKNMIAVISCPSFNEKSPYRDVVERLKQNRNIKVRCTGFSSFCDENNAVYLPTKQSIGLPSSIERALSAPLREVHPERWGLCAPNIVVSVPRCGPVEVMPAEKPCDN